MNKSYIDLHMHSLYSDDGEFTPTQLVEMCHEAGYDSYFGFGQHRKYSCSP